MIRMFVTSLKPGMIVARPVFDEEGNLLLGKGMVLNEFLIRGLKLKKIASIFIHDDNTEDIVPKEPISVVVRGSTIRELKSLVRSLEGIKQEMKRFSILSVSELLGSTRFKVVFGDNPVLRNIRESAAAIVEELLCDEVGLGLNSIKTFDNYLYEHSIDVAVFSIMMGRKLDLSPRRLRELGIGCLLHDIGMTFIPKPIIEKESPLTHDEFEQVKLHPEIGYELLKDVAQFGVLPPHIAFQHHEKQDGTGYPRGMMGDPRLEIGEKPRQIHLYASICAIADVYDALVSDRSFRPAYPVDEALGMMVAMGGTHLHERLLNVFLSFAPSFPVGTTVKVIGGKYDGFMGIVKSLNSRDLHRPVVRLILDSGRKRIDPIELNVYEQNDVMLEAMILS